MDRRRPTNVVRGQFGRPQGSKWTSASDFVPHFQTRPTKNRRRLGRSGSSGWRKYTPLWLLAVLVGLAYGSGTFSGSGDKSPLLSIGQGSEHPPAYYRRCDDARAAGAAPIRRGEPGYREALDRDRDGVACEPYFGD